MDKKKILKRRQDINNIYYAFEKQYPICHKEAFLIFFKPLERQPSAAQETLLTRTQDFCTNCRNSVPPTSGSFCEFCGTKLST